MEYAETVLDLCRMFHVLPSQLYAEPAGLLRLLRIEDEGRRDEDRPAPDLD